MARFKLLAGIHVQADPKWQPTKAEIEEARANGVKLKAPSVTFKQGDTVESDDDLVAKFGSTKFTLLSGKPKVTQPAVRGYVAPHGQVSQGHQETAGGVPGLQDPIEAAEEAGEAPEVPGDSAAKSALVSSGEQQPDGSKGARKATQEEDLDGMTVADLKELADTEEIDLSGAHRKDEIIKAIRKGRRG